MSLISFFKPMTVTESIFKNIPTLETPRLYLRRIMESDYRDMYEYSQNSEVTKYLTWYEHDNPEYTKCYLKELQKAYKRGEFFDWGLEYKPHSKFIGTAGFTLIDEDNNSAEIGYVLNPQYQGLGLMTEAITEILDFGFSTLCFERIYARHIKGNDASAEVMKRCGMSYEGELRNSLFVKGEYKTVMIYSILKEEYKKNK